MQPNLVLAGLCGEDFFYSSPKHSIGKTTSHFQGGFYLTLTFKPPIAKSAMILFICHCPSDPVLLCIIHTSLTLEVPPR